MYLKRSISVILHILFYFVLSYSCDDFDEYLSILAPTYDEIKNISTLFWDDICSTHFTKKCYWGSICKIAVQRLRSDAEFSTMFVNYSAFKDTEKCIKGRVWIPAWEIHVSQPLLTCNVRSLVIPLDTPDEFTEDSKLFVFPKNKHTLMLFTYNQIKESYEFRKMVKYFHWNRLKDVPPPVFDSTIGLPKSYSTINGMYDQLHNKVYSDKSENIVITSEVSVFRRLCRLGYTRAKYSEYNFTFFYNKPRSITKLTTLRSEEPESVIYFYTKLFKCRGKTTTPEGSLQTSEKYYIAAGPDVKSMILVLRILDDYYEVTEYITNIDLKYLDFLNYY